MTVGGADATTYPGWGCWTGCWSYGPASDFEDQRPGTSPRALYDLLHSPAGFAGYNISRENAYRVAWQLAHTL